MKTALLSGGAGYVGGHVALALHDAGWRVVVLDDLSTGVREGVLPQAAFYEGDINDATLLARIFDEHEIAAVLHLAAVASVPESFADPERCEHINVGGSKTLMQAALRAGAPHVVFSSTSVVYDEDAPLPFDEDAPKKPLSPYARTKLAAEEALFDAGFDGVAVLRYFNVGGADRQLRAGSRKKHDTTLIKSALECAAGRRPLLKMYGEDYPTPDGTCIRDYVHVSDIAAAHVNALDYLIAGGASNAFNLGLGRGFSVREVLAAAKKVTGRDFTVEVAPRRDGDPPVIYANADKARRMLRFQPQTTALEEIIADSWAWEQARQD